MTMNATLMSVAPIPQARPGWLQRRLLPGVTVSTGLLGCIVLLAAFLHGHNLDAIGDGNQYYTAAVKSMLQSWYNFFFVAAEPGGSLTIDKPPLGLWFETLSAFFFGVNGFAVVLPNILAGVAGIAAIYAIVRKRHGEGAGLIAALTIAVTPVAIAAQRNNTVDGMLTFSLVLAAWAFLKATETGKVRYLWLGAFLVGVGFNIKMLQAFLPLPAFFGLYFLGAKMSIGRKILHLLLAFGIVLVTSLCWVAIVDLTPSDQRPYIGGTEENLVLELIVQHNGVNRLLGRGAGNGGTPARRSSSASSGTGEVGEKGILRFWSAPLSAEMSWLLPFALVGMKLLALGHKIRWPIAPEHRELVLWGGWLAACLVFFSIAGHFHAYYLVTLVPPLGALVGMTVADLGSRIQKGCGWAMTLLIGAVALTVIYQWFNVLQYNVQASWAFLGLAGCIVGAVIVWMPALRRWRPLGMVMLVLAMMIVPLTWSWLTNQYGQVGRLPRAYQGAERRSTGGGDTQSAVNEGLLDYLVTHTTGVKYLIATQSAMVGAPYVLATGRPVLYMGGFAGDIPVVSIDDVAALVAAGDLRYILGSGGGMSGGRSQNSISTWAATQCARVEDLGTPTGGLSQRSARRVNSGVLLYDCAGSP